MTQTVNAPHDAPLFSGVPAWKPAFLLRREQQQQAQQQSRKSRGPVGDPSPATKGPRIRLLHFDTYQSAHVTAELKHALVASLRGLASGLKPQRPSIDDGINGVYMLRDSATNAPVAVFKPTDEEAMAPNNPKHMTGCEGEPGIKPGVRSGEQAVREASAYLLDHGGLAGVPPTALVRIDAPKLFARPSPAASPVSSKTGSFQVYLPGREPASDMGPQRFDHAGVQAIALLDMRIMNADRHDGNVLVDPRDGSVAAIDHGCCLPECPVVLDAEWAWLHWPQSADPVSPALRRATLAIDPAADAAVLRAVGVREGGVRTMLAATCLVQACLARHPEMPLRSIAKLLCRASDKKRAVVERLVSRARWLTAAKRRNETTEANFETDFLVVFRGLADRFVDTL